MNTVAEVMNSMESIIYFLFCFIRVLLVKIVESSKLYRERITSMEQTIDEQSDLIASLESENKMLKFKESKFKLALDNLLERSENQRKEIQNLKNIVGELEENNYDCALHIQNLKSDSKRKGRALVRMQLQLDMLKCNLRH